MRDGIVERLAAQLATTAAPPAAAVVVPEAPLAESRQRRVEAGLAAVQEVEQERDRCRSELATLAVEHRGLQAEHDALRIAHARLQGEVEAYRLDRDDAVEKRARADALIEAVLTLLAKHRGPSLRDELGTEQGA